MTTGTIEKLHAAPDAQARPFRGIPASLPLTSIEPLLASLGLGAQVKIAAAAKQPLALADVDKALTANGVSVTDRIRLKRVLERAGILGN
jgi:hypothetical protein